MAIESIERLFNPSTIHYNEAIGVAIIGLLVNIASVFILHDNHHHTHRHGDHSRHHYHYDNNLKAAYFHVLADALTSLLAIIAREFYGWIWMDVIMGIIGSLIITQWAYNLIKKAALFFLIIQLLIHRA